MCEYKIRHRIQNKTPVTHMNQYLCYSNKVIKKVPTVLMNKIHLLKSALNTDVVHQTDKGSTETCTRWAIESLT